MTELVIKSPADVESELPAVTQWAQGLVVTSADDFEAAGERLKTIKGLSKRIVDFFKPMKQAADATKKAILDAEKKLSVPLENAELLAKRAMLGYQQAEQRKADEERRRLQAEADEAARREREALEKKAAAAKKPETQAKHAEAAAMVVAPVVHVAADTPKVAGIATVKTWKYRIVDAAAIPREFLMVDEKKLGQFARAMKDGATVAGVEFYCEETLSSKGY